MPHQMKSIKSPSYDIDKSKSAIKFGTDGWRGIIAEDFTFSNVRRVAQAISDYLTESGEGYKGIVVGYDTRFMSERFAKEIAYVLSNNSIPVSLTVKSTPTPVVSFAVRTRGAAMGMVVTASHNPPEYNGLKLKDSYGGPVTLEITNRLQKYLERSILKKDDTAERGKERLKSQTDLFDPKSEYLAHIHQFADEKPIRKSELKVVVDSMHGAASGYLKEILFSLGVEAIEIRNDPNPLFGGISPEPTAINLKPLSEAVVQLQADIGLATDGDGDRIAAVDEKGNYISPQQIFPLLLSHLVKDRGWTGAVAKTVSTTQMVDVLCEKFNLPLYETPVGFKYISELMQNQDILIGGEESGGIGIKGHIPERDGILGGVMLVEVMAICGKQISRLVQELYEEVGYFYYKRKDLTIQSLDKQEMIRERIDKLQPARIAGEKVILINQTDGVKYILEDGSWLLLRLSGTEPLLRIYSGSQAQKKVQQLLMEGQRYASMSKVYP